MQIFWKAPIKCKGTLPYTYTLDEPQGIYRNAHSNLVWVEEKYKTEETLRRYSLTEVSELWQGHTVERYHSFQGREHLWTRESPWLLSFLRTSVVTPSLSVLLGFWASQASSAVFTHADNIAPGAALRRTQTRQAPARRPSEPWGLQRLLHGRHVWAQRRAFHI